MLKLLQALCFLTTLSDCGGAKKPYGEDKPPVPPLGWSEVNPVVHRECVNCHDGAAHPLDLRAENNYNQKKVETRIKNASMPPNKKLDPYDKNILLSYFQ